MVRGDFAPEYKDPGNHAWGAMWDENDSGRIAMVDYSTDVTIIGAMVLGLDPRSLSDDDLAEVHKKLGEQVPLNRTLCSSMTEISQMMASGEVAMAVGWNSLIWQVQKPTRRPTGSG